MNAAIRTVLFGRGSSAVASNPNHASWPNLVGDEMITTPDMSSSTGWTQPSGSAISGGKMNWTALAAGAGATNAGVPAEALISGARYLCAFDLSSVLGGEVAIALGDQEGTHSTSSLSEVLPAVDPLGVGFKIYNPTAGTATLAIDNVSVKTYGGMGQEASWAFTGDVFWITGSGGAPNFDPGSAEGSKAELTGGSKASFDAAVSNSTACSVTLTTSAGNSLIGTVSVTMKGGTPVNFVGDGGGSPITHTVTSGTGSGFILTAGNDGPGGDIILIQISLA